MEEHIKTATDTTLGAGAVSSPLWLPFLQAGFALYMLIGGALLLTLRLAIAWREFRRAK